MTLPPSGNSDHYQETVMGALLRLPTAPRSNIAGWIKCRGYFSTGINKVHLNSPAPAANCTDTITLLSLCDVVQCLNYL